jgi:PAS domain S-box-containing protein
MQHAQPSRQGADSTHSTEPTAESRYQRIVEASYDSIVRLDDAGTVLEINDAGAALLGSTAHDHSDIVGQPWVTFIAADDLVREPFDPAIVRSRGRTRSERRLRRFDGTYLIVEVTKIADPDGGMQCLVRDVTERARLDEQLRLAAKMQAVGQLAGGIAHDFNNVLTIIHGSTEILLQVQARDGESAEDLRTILDACDRARTLTRQLLTFTRHEVVRPAMHRVDDVVRGVAPLLERLLRRQMRLSIAMDAGDLSVMIDAGQLELALMNLVANARDATPGVGTVTLRTSRRDLSSHDLRLAQGLHVGAYASISVADEGVGISADVRAHLFEPFFTTKPQGEGTGLGLATVYGVIQRAGGTVLCQSTQGVGTRFELLLPTRDHAIDAVRPGSDIVQTHSAAATPTPPTILIVDDEADIRTLTARALQRLGFPVRTAASAPDAIAYLERHPGEIGVVLTDFAMPDMNGRELLEAVWGRWPRIATVLMSGYASDEVTRTAMGHTTTPFLAKPFTLDELTAALRQVVQASAGAAASESAGESAGESGGARG